MEEGQQLPFLQSVYGLKQAARDWFNIYGNMLKAIGFESADADPCLWIKPSRGLFVLVYVDNITIVSEELASI